MGFQWIWIHMPQKIGLVFSGGGGKGAYQIGVWKALEEYGVAENISVVSGTSVGALNAALFSQGCYQTAENAWLSISPADILHLDLQQVAKLLITAGIPGPRALKLVGLLSSGGFSRSGLERIIDSYLDEETIHAKNITSFAHCTRLPFAGETFRLDGQRKNRIKKILLASSAIPGAFGVERIDGCTYVDGFFTNNTPIKPVYDAGCDVIINVFLGRIGDFFDDCYIKHDDFPKAVIMDIVPQKDLGGLITGVLNFKNIAQKIEYGYQDAKRIIKPIWSMSQAQFRYDELLEKAQTLHQEMRFTYDRILAADNDMHQGKKALRNELKRW